MNKTHWQDWVSVLVGVWLIATPFAFGLVDGTFYWAAGVVVLVIAALEIAGYARWKEWLLAAIGTFLVLAPRLFSFTDDTQVWNVAISGLAVIAMAGWAIGDSHEVLPKLKRAPGDLRGDTLGISVPDESEHFAGLTPHRPDAGPNLVGPGVTVQSPGQASHE